MTKRCHHVLCYWQHIYEKYNKIILQMVSCDPLNVNSISPQHSRHIKHRKAQCLCRNKLKHQCRSRGISAPPSFTETVLSLTHCLRNLRQRMWSQHSVEFENFHLVLLSQGPLPSCPPHFTNHCSQAQRIKPGAYTFPATESRSDWGNGHRCQPEQRRKEGDFHSPQRCPGSDRSLPTERKVPELDQGWKVRRWCEMTDTYQMSLHK